MKTDAAKVHVWSSHGYGSGILVSIPLRNNIKSSQVNHLYRDMIISVLIFLPLQGVVQLEWITGHFIVSALENNGPALLYSYIQTQHILHMHTHTRHN